MEGKVVFKKFVKMDSIYTEDDFLVSQGVKVDWVRVSNCYSYNSITDDFDKKGKVYAIEIPKKDAAPSLMGAFIAAGYNKEAV